MCGLKPRRVRNRKKRGDILLHALPPSGLRPCTRRIAELPCALPNSASPVSRPLAVFDDSAGLNKGAKFTVGVSEES